MNLLEHVGKQLIREAGLATPRGLLATTPDEAVAAARQLGGAVALKSQIPAGKRGKAGGIAFASSLGEARVEADNLLGRSIAGHRVTAVLVEQRADIAQELYAAILNDATGKCPILIFSTEGGMDIEEVSAAEPHRVHRVAIDIRQGLRHGELEELVSRAGLAGDVRAGVVEALERLYGLYRDVDAELVEVNPLVVTREGSVIALDAKISLDPGALARHRGLVDDDALAATSSATDRVQAARDLGLALIELDGNVGVLANGAGLTMTTLDAVSHYGGRAANFLEIGGDAYTKATPALEIVLSDPAIRSVVVNFCGAFARTDVMAEGVVKAIQELRPDVPFFFSIHGTGEDEAIRMVREGLDIEPFDRMDDAVKAAVEAADRAEEVA